MTDDEVKALFERAVGEIRRHFDVTAERLEGRIDLVDEALTRLDEKLDRSVDRLDQKIERTAADTQAMIKFSHAELDRRHPRRRFRRSAGARRAARVDALACR